MKKEMDNTEKPVPRVVNTHKHRSCNILNTNFN